MSDEIYDDLDSNFIENSLCKNCIYRVSREIKPLASSIDLWEESLGIDIQDDTILETHCCELLGIDLDHIVLKCNKYKAEDADTFINSISNINKLCVNKSKQTDTDKKPINNDE